MNQRAAVIVLGLIAVVALVWLATRLERVTETRQTGMSGEARRNPYLAAQRLMIRMGLPSREVKTVRDLEQLPPRGVLILPNHRQSLAPEHRGRLLGWVARGGHLIVETEMMGVDDPLADTLGVRREHTGAPGKGRSVTLPHATDPLRVPGLGTHQKLVAPAQGVRTRAETAWGLQLLQLTRGKGLVTVVTDLAFAENHQIGQADHAEFLWQLARSMPETREVLVFSRLERLSLWRWLTDHAPAVIVSGALLLALWLWHVGPRFGPMAPDPAPARRRLLDHLRASGRFYWRNNGRERLTEAAREACLARLTRAQPGFASLPPAERVQRVAAFAAISEADARRFLEPDEVRRGAEFIALMRTLQQVHVRLDGGKNPSH